jgi:rRNA-processing protein CGR1
VLAWIEQFSHTLGYPATHFYCFSLRKVLTARSNLVAYTTTYRTIHNEEFFIMRVNGKNWRDARLAFRPTLNVTLPTAPASSSSTSTVPKSATASSRAFELRRAATTSLAATKAKEKELKDEKEAVRQSRIVKIRERREKKAERERWEKLQEKMGRKRADRKKRKEARNKLLKS